MELHKPIKIPLGNKSLALKMDKNDDDDNNNEEDIIHEISPESIPINE